ncbi:MAG: gamma-glutamyl-gamma-aminobutyrate hydrolase family protein [Lachnospiraceae bacterium]|nr:gamma-glutamyl-gamma-aminobutyrate hydrolase family protein [Lachnospiraceae bacterium]
MKCKKIKTLAAFLITIMLVMVFSSCGKAGNTTGSLVIGVAWRSDQTSESYVSTCKAIEKAGGTVKVLDQVLSYDLSYENNKLIEGKAKDGSLSQDAAKLVKNNTWQNSNAEKVMEGINVIVFPGGEDISPSLYYHPQEVETKEGFSAERDVSDYLLMNYCLEKDIKILAICRGMQMLSVVSGAELIQDIPEYYRKNGADYGYEHRNEPKEPGGYRDFSFHDVNVTESDSILHELMGTDVIENVPSWHHQAVVSVEGTRLKVTGTTKISGIEFIEAVERADKTFVLGIQFHPEIAVVRDLDRTSITYFNKIVELAK